MASCQCCLCDVDTYLHPEKCPIKREEAEKKLLIGELAVHHKDGNPYNNDFENIELVDIRNKSENW
jgi:hypothetical protein